MGYLQLSNIAGDILHLSLHITVPVYDPPYDEEQRQCPRNQLRKGDNCCVNDDLILLIVQIILRCLDNTWTMM